MEKYEEEEIIEKIIQKKKAGMDERKIIKFLELAGYPLRLLEEANRKLGKGTKEIQEEENPLMIKITGTLFVFSALIELFYFFHLVPEEKYTVVGLEFGLLALLGVLFFISLILGFGFFQTKFWGFNYSSVTIFLRMLLLGYLVWVGYTFFLLIIGMDLVIEIIILIISPSFKEKNKLKNERKQMMQEVKNHKLGLDKKQEWEN